MTPTHVNATRSTVSGRSLPREEIERRQTSFAALVRRMGRLYVGCRLANYEARHDGQRQALRVLKRYDDAMPARLNAGDGIVWFGPAGTGKDHMLVAMIHQAIVRWGARVVWQNGVEWIDRLQRGEACIPADDPPDLLAISDPVGPFGSLTDWKAERLFIEIDRCYRRSIPVWLTMNCASRAEAENRLSTPIIDRISDRATCIFCDWPSFRRPAQVIKESSK